jgi:methylenetetrahydrofolate dehydrogenase (NADP+)/methenyltetrahydrofolate cyclohydrolase/formyltetrahydrofolate synthetase
MNTSLPVSHTPQKRPFSSTQSEMAATKIDGTAIAKSIRERLHSEILATQKTNPRYKPSLKIIQGNFCANSVTDLR